MKSHLDLFAAITVVALASPIYSQTWEVIEPGKQGFARETVINLASNGLDWPIYVLHQNSLSRYNGVWQNFSNNLGMSSAGAVNTTLYFDPNGGLWIGRSNGLYFVSADTLKSASPKAENKTATYFTKSNSPLPHVSAIFCDRNNKLWIGSFTHGLICAGLNGKKSEVEFAVEECADVKFVTDIVQDENPLSRSIWVGTLLGLFQFRANGESVGQFLPDKTINGLHADRQGRVWVATDDSLYVALNPGAASFVGVNISKNCRGGTPYKNFIQDVVQDYADAIWVSAQDMLYRYQNTSARNPKNWIPEIFPCRNEWPKNLTTINKLSVDLAGFLWAITPFEGLLRYNMIWETIKFSQRDDIGIKSDVVNTLYLSPIDGSLYSGTNSGAAQRDKNGQWQAIRFDQGLCSDSARVHAFYHDAKTDYVVMGAYCGTLASTLAIWDGKNVRGVGCMNCAGFFVNTVFKSIIKLPNDNLWLGGDNHLWATQIKKPLEDVKYTRTSDDLGLRPRQQYYALLLDTLSSKNGKYVWIGANDSGLVRYDLAKAQVDLRLRQIGNFKSASVRSLHLSEENRLWVGTDKGITQLLQTNNSFAWKDLPNVNGAVNFIFSDREGNLWFNAPDGGVARYNSQYGVSLFPNRSTITASGPADRVVNAGVSVIEANNKESLWFGTNSGLSIFRGDMFPPETRITRPARSDPKFNFGEQDILNWAASSLFIEYEGFDNLTSAQNLEFRTALVKDVIKDRIPWNEFSPKRSEEIFFRESGTYYFLVQARDQIGNQDFSSAILVINVDIDAPSVAITQPALKADGSLPWMPGKLVVLGSVLDADLDSFVVEIIDPETDKRIIDPRSETKQPFPAAPAIKNPVRDSVLATFKDAGVFHEQTIRLRLTAVDDLKHFRRDSVEVRVDSLRPVLRIARPADSTQFVTKVETQFRFRERNRPGTIEYSEAGANKPPRPIFIQNPIKDPVSEDSLFYANLDDVGAALGKHTLIFRLNDLAGNFAQDTLFVIRVAPQNSGKGTTWQSRDGIVEVYLPPGGENDPVSVRISPLAAAYQDTARDCKLQPRSEAYQIELDNIRHREMTLSFTLGEAGSDTNRLAIFQRAGSCWNSIGGRYFSTDKTLRTVIKQGGIFLAAQGERKFSQSGNVTCLPRMFSPGLPNLAAFTDVVFSLNRESPVFIHVYNPAGRQVWKWLRDGEVMPPGRHAVRWDGYSNDRQKLRSGIYIVVVKTNTFAETKTVVIQN